MMFLKFSDEAQKLLLLSLKEKNKLNDLFIGTEHVFLAALTMKNTHICKLLNENNISYEKFNSFLNKKITEDKSNYYIFTPLMSDIFNNLASNHNRKNQDILISDIIIEILNSSNSKAVLILKRMNIDVHKLFKSLSINNKKKRIKKGILNDLGINLNEKFSNSKEIVLERDQEIDMIIEILCCKNKNNPILIGDAGVGKTAIVEELARRIAIGEIPYKLKNKKIYSIAMSSLVAGTKYRGEFEEKINKMVSEIENSDDIILFIDEIHTLVGAGGADGAIDASNILKPYLARGNIKVIGATTKEEYKKYFANDKALSRRFQIVNILEPNIDKTEKILLGIKKNYEEYHKVKISDQMIKKIIYYADKYIKNRKFPDKAIDILDEVCVLSSIFYNKDYNCIINLDKELNKIIDLKNKALIEGNYKDAIKYSRDEKNLQYKMGKTQKNIFNKQKIVEVEEKILLKVMERKTNIPFYTYNHEYHNINKKINEYKSNSILEEQTNDKIINFTLDTITNIVNSSISNSLFIRSSKYGLNTYFIDDYINSFFSNCNIINIDISNFRNIDDLLSENSLYNKNDNFINKIKNDSFSIAIINNLESADYSVQEFFDKINKYGYYVNRDNEKINFSNVLFIYNIVSSEKIGFNNNENGIDDKLYIDVDNISNIRLKKKIKKICNGYNYEISNKIINNIFNDIILDMDKLSNIEFFVRKELSNINVRNIKSKTIKV